MALQSESAFLFAVELLWNSEDPEQGFHLDLVVATDHLPVTAVHHPLDCVRRRQSRRRRQTWYQQ